MEPQINFPNQFYCFSVIYDFEEGLSKGSKGEAVGHNTFCTKLFCAQAKCFVSIMRGGTRVRNKVSIILIVPKEDVIIVGIGEAFSNQRRNRLVECFCFSLILA